LSHRSLQTVKPEIRVLGVDDGKFVPHSKARVPVVGIVFRGGYWLDGVMSTHVEVDGLDGTAQIASMIKSSPHYGQLRVVMLSGVTLGGFNVVDIKALNAETGLPIIAVTTRKPNLADVRSALKHLSNSDERWQAILAAGEVFPVVTRKGKLPVYVETMGIKRELAVEVLKLTATRSRLPEPLRVAHLVASGISLYTT
jgi:endonuclease V-like protein UPF0215 family